MKIKYFLNWDGGFKSLYKNFIKIKGTKGKIEVKFIFAKTSNSGS